MKLDTGQTELCNKCGCEMDRMDTYGKNPEKPKKTLYICSSCYKTRGEK